MGENHFSIIIAEIKQELKHFEQLAPECKQFYELNKNQIDSSTNLRVLGSILHDFYTYIENIFRKIAIFIDDELPSDPTWHSILLNRMSLSIANIRKNVINDDLKETLYDYLRFRHIFRNIYGFKLNWDKMSHLVKSIESTQKTANKQITEFLEFLEKMQ